jgi:hypothetical protein
MRVRKLTTLITTALGLVVCVLALSAPAQAQAVGATDVDITIPDIVILHYYSEVDVTISQADLGTFLGTGGSASVDEGIAPAASGFTSDLTITPSGLTGNPGAATLTLQNAWGVRAISLAGGTNTQLAITITDPTLDHSSTLATMDITAGTVTAGATTGATISFASPGLAVPLVGDVELVLDMTLSTNAGDYLDGEYTLTATNI